MTKLTVLSKNNGYKTIRLLIFGSMCLLTLFSIAAAVHNDMFRNSYVCFIEISSIIGLTFLSLLSGLLLLKTEEITRSMWYLALFLVALYATAFCLTVGFSFYGTPNHTGLLTLLCTLSYFSSNMAFLTLWLYQKQFIIASAVTRTVTVLMIVTAAVYTAAIIINLFHPILFLFTKQGYFSDDVTDYLSMIIVCVCLVLLFVATFSSNLSRSRKFSFLCCILFPALFGVLSINEELLDWGIYILGLFCVTILLPLYLIFFNTYDELESDVLRYKEKQRQLQVSAMISQMQPHFLSNSLAVISALCEEDPRLAAEATNAFSDYLRENMDFANKSNPVSFSEELNHIKTYVWLEKLRFPNKLNVEYDIGCTTFPVPALSIQPIVENAIKHGICKARSGGTVRIRSFETDQFNTVIVSDDGVGFDVQETMDDGSQHLGIKNTRYRLREMVGGSLDIHSVPGSGTVVTIRIPK